MKGAIISGFALFFLFFAPSADAAKSISVDLSKQTLYAMEDGTIVNQTLISSGLPLSPTVRGNFTIQRKVALHAMSGVSPYKGRYYLPNVPHTMYFYQNYAIHGAYWHHNFGQPMSNGCVNVSLPFAAWLFEWTPEGTPVQII